MFEPCFQSHKGLRLCLTNGIQSRSETDLTCFDDYSRGVRLWGMEPGVEVEREKHTSSGFCRERVRLFWRFEFCQRSLSIRFRLFGVIGSRFTAHPVGEPLAIAAGGGEVGRIEPTECRLIVACKVEI